MNTTTHPIRFSGSNKELTRIIGAYMNDNGLVIDTFDADRFMIDQLRDYNISHSEAQLWAVIKELYPN